MSRFQFVHDHQDTDTVKRLCQVIGIHRSSYYKWRAGIAARERRRADDAALAEQIRAVHLEWDQTYGAPRITAELRAKGLPVNRKRVARVMREHGIAGLVLHKKHRTTITDPDSSPVPDLLGRDFTATAPNQRYVGDITYLPLAGGEFLYLATVIDCCSKRLVGWRIADHMRTDLVADALRAAERARGSLSGAIFHSDHGAQYTSRAYAELCQDLGVSRSMGAIGSSADNAAAESFNATLKRETLQGAHAWPSEHACRLALFRWLNRYNTRRRHSANGYLSPNDYETAHPATLDLAA